MNVIGIDPGADGAVVVITEGRKAIRQMLTKEATWKDLRRFLQGEAIDDCRAFLELVGGMPRDGGHRAFKFGENYGRWQEILEGSAGIPHEKVPPAQWQQAVGVGRKFASRTERKRAHKAAAERLFPNMRVTLSNCDALLIAEYGYNLITRKEQP